jgi:hypothetical protein
LTKASGCNKEALLSRKDLFETSVTDEVAGYSFQGAEKGKATLQSHVAAPLIITD